MNSVTLQESIQKLQAKMERARNPEIASSMSDYLKNKFECLGIKAPQRNAIEKEWFQTIKPLSLDHFDVAFALWELNEREYQYIAVDYLNKTPKTLIQKSDHISLERLIVSKSWWETVDLIASNYVGAYFLKFPEQKKTIIEEWRHSDNFWLNRTCLIFQLKYKDAVDFELLKDLIIQYQGENEFFIQKAIGWSLRQYSKYNPDVVRSFVDEIKLEGLARREAVKYL